MQDDNRKTKTKVDFVNAFLTKEQRELRLKNIRKWLGMNNEKENFECEEAYATEEEYAKQSKRIREMDIEVKEKSKILSNWEKEEIFFVRWFTFISATVFSLVIWVLFFGLNGIMAITIFGLNFGVPPFFFFRKGIWKYVKENISYWWSMLNGRIP